MGLGGVTVLFGLCTSCAVEDSVERPAVGWVPGLRGLPYWVCQEHKNREVGR